MQSAVIAHPDRDWLIDDDLPNPPGCASSPLDSAQSRRATRLPVIITAPPWTPALRPWLHS